jgi:putative restriction endonuclease
MNDPDADIRLAAFRFLEEQTTKAGSDGALRREVLIAGFEFSGRRVPLMSPQQGIFKPAAFTGMPLSITTVPVVRGRDRPYDDVMGDDGRLQYRYRGNDPSHRDNRGLRTAMQLQVPLIYFHGIVPSVYVPEWPVYVVGDNPQALTFTVAIDERRFASLGTLLSAPEDSEIRRRYAWR